MADYEIRPYSGRLCLLLSEESEIGMIFRLKARYAFLRLLLRPTNIRKWIKWKNVRAAEIHFIPGGHTTSNWLNPSDEDRAHIARLAELINLCLEGRKNAKNI